jgi:hypothetical protein
LNPSKSKQEKEKSRFTEAPDLARIIVEALRACEEIHREPHLEKQQTRFEDL